MGDLAGKMTFFDTLNCMAIGLDRQLNILFMNRFGSDQLGYQSSQLVGKPFRTLVPADDALSIDFLTRIATLSPSDGPSPIDAELMHSNGSRMSFSWSFGTPLDATTATVLIGFHAVKVTENRVEPEMFRMVSDNFIGSIVITDPQKQILYVNPALLQMTGYSREDVIGQTPSLFKSGDTPAEVYESLWQTIEAGGIWRGEFINRRRDGSHYLESKTIAAIRDTRGAVQFYIAIGEDISQRQHYQEHIENLLTLDLLTGLPNRPAFLRLLTDALKDAQRSGSHATLLHVDIDDFFTINDTVGADDADKVMVMVAEQIKNVLRQTDQLARLGNDKFGILLAPHGAESADDIGEIAKRVLNAIRQSVDLADLPVRPTASIGISGFPTDGNDANELISHAINATERAKALGGDHYARYDATAGNFSERRERLNELRQAIDREELVLHFQPQVSLFSGAIVGLEALIRWQHPERGMVPPGGFIPLAEQSSLIVDIGNWALRDTCRQMRAWQKAGLPPVKVAVNLAARHFVIPDLAASVANILAEYSIESRLLEIEITESVMMQDVAAAIRSTTQLKDVGIHISLDDFGTGYSSLAYLSRFPIDVVKIDQSFVRDITSNPANAAIAQATIAMSHKLGKRVLAEGVETEEQMQYLRRNECDEMQGYFFSKPLPAEAIASLLRSGATMRTSAAVDPETRSTVLFVDDELSILSSLRRTLRREGYEILTANSAAEGFSLLAKNSIQVIVSDQRMPEMNGTEFLARVKSLYPNTVRMILSGYAEVSSVTDSINKGAVYRFMLKPWDDEQLKQEIAGALRHWRELHAV